MMWRRLVLRLRGLRKQQCHRCDEAARPRYRNWNVGPPGLYCPECGADVGASRGPEASA